MEAFFRACFIVSSFKQNGCLQLSGINVNLCTLWSEQKQNIFPVMVVVLLGHPVQFKQVTTPTFENTHVVK